MIRRESKPKAIAGFSRAESRHARHRARGTGSICEFTDNHGRPRLKVGVTMNGKQRWTTLPPGSTREDAEAEIVSRKRTGSLELRKGIWHARLTVRDQDGAVARPWYSLDTDDRATAEQKLAALVKVTTGSSPAWPDLEYKQRLQEMQSAKRALAVERVNSAIVALGTNSDDVVRLRDLLRGRELESDDVLFAIAELEKNGRIAVYIDATANVPGRELNRAPTTELPVELKSVRETKLSAALAEVRKVNEARLAKSRRTV
jgi:multidrug efflux pump subunit AcrA (membrane-fusion protein)